jgi:hypothetical protein
MNLDKVISNYTKEDKIVIKFFSVNDFKNKKYALK